MKVLKSNREQAGLKVPKPFSSQSHAGEVRIIRPARQVMHKTHKTMKGPFDGSENRKPRPGRHLMSADQSETGTGHSGKTRSRDPQRSDRRKFPLFSSLVAASS